MDLRRLGDILRQSKNRNLILKPKSGPPPGLGANIYDGKRRPLGVVVDVFGPVRSPYVEIRPFSADAEKLVGKGAYMRTERDRA
jgi:rRNA processing protein Gar1